MNPFLKFGLPGDKSSDELLRLLSHFFGQLDIILYNTSNYTIDIIFI